MRNSHLRSDSGGFLKKGPTGKWSSFFINCASVLARREVSARVRNPEEYGIKDGHNDQGQQGGKAQPGDDLTAMDLKKTSCKRGAVPSIVVTAAMVKGRRRLTPASMTA